MSLFMVIGLWLIAWVLIIILHAIAVNMYNSDLKNHGEEYIEILSFPKAKAEMIGDGNNLFATGIAYCIASTACYFIDNNILSWICIALGIIFCVPSIISIVPMYVQAVQARNKYITMMTLTATINTFIPMVIALNIYYL